MVLTNVDAKRLASTVRMRAARGQTQLGRIIKLSKNKRVTTATMLRIAESLQNAYAQIRHIEGLIGDFLD